MRLVTILLMLLMTGMLVIWPPETLVGLTLVRMTKVRGVKDDSPFAMWLLNSVLRVTTRLSPRSVLIVLIELRTLGTFTRRGRELGNVLWVTRAAMIGTLARLVK